MTETVLTLPVGSLMSMNIQAPPLFPSAVHVGGTHITLYADGTWIGDGPAFLRALESAKQDGTPITMPILWLIANAIRNSEPGI